MNNQRTDDWFFLRCGKITASRMSAVMNFLKNGSPGAERKKYINELIVERLTGTPVQHYVNFAMQHGIDTEPMAKNAYILSTGNIVEDCGFVEHPTIPNTGASPDGLIGKDGLIEIKCPEPITHVETLISGEIKKDYILQIQWQLECTGRSWCDFVSFDDRLPEKFQLFTKKIERDDDLINEIKQQVLALNAEIDGILKNLEKGI